MAGKRIEISVEALKLFLHSLPPGSMFNIISFGTNFHSMDNLNECIEYNEENL